MHITMTEKQIIRFFKYLKHKKKLSWKQISKYLHNKINFNQFLLRFVEQGYIKTDTPPQCKNGHIIYTEDALFSLDIGAYNLLDDVKDSFFQNRLPVILSILAILKSYKLGPDDIILWCMQLLGLR